MPIPDFQTLMLPVLSIISKQDASTSKLVIAYAIKTFQLTDEERAQLLPSKTQRVIDNRVYWSLVYLQRAGLIVRLSRGNYKITDLGLKILEEKPERIDIRFLARFESFRDFKSLSKQRDRSSSTVLDHTVSDEPTDPREQLEASYERLKSTACAELLQHAQKMDPTDFELLVIKLLKKMGYGHTGLESILHKGRSGDGGIDGEISQDQLGLDMIYIQAKRYKDGSGVGRPAIQQFVGSLNERKANKGTFMTTSHFSEEAKGSIDRIDVKVVLIDGTKLAQLMYDHDIGVVSKQRYDIKHVDHDFFEQAE